MASKETSRGSFASRRNPCRYGLSIVRTLVSPNPEISSLVEGIQEVLDDAFVAHTKEKGITLVESRTVLHSIKDSRGTVDRRMLRDAEAKLNDEMRRNNLGQSPIEVRVNPRKPLRMFGLHNDVLALNFEEDMRLGADRGAIETFVDTHYPPIKMPRKVKGKRNINETHETEQKKQTRKPLEPHVTLGTIKPQLLREGTLADLIENALDFMNKPPLEASPMDLLIHNGSPDRVIVPDYVALNGLRIQVEPHEQH